MSGRARLPDSRPSDASPLSAASLALIGREVAKYPPKRGASAVMAALRIAQKERGWLSRETIEVVAGILDIPAIRALEVATFYNMYDLRPVGRWKLCVCTNLPCALRGADETADAMKAELGVGFGGTTADGEFTLAEGECFGSCDMAPAVIVNNERLLGPLPAERVSEFLSRLRVEKQNDKVPELPGIPGLAEAVQRGDGGGSADGKTSKTQTQQQPAEAVKEDDEGGNKGESADERASKTRTRRQPAKAAKKDDGDGSKVASKGGRKRVKKGASKGGSEGGSGE